MNTVTGRFKPVLSNVEDLPKGANYMVTTNRAQLAAAIKAVGREGTTVIDAINEKGARLVRYTFCRSGIRIAKPRSGDSYEKHLRTLARKVMKTPASYWR